MSLKGKNIVLGVCGSIAAYKSALLVRLLTKMGASVQVIMTQEAKSFITPLTLSTLSNNPVLTDYYDEKTGEWNSHVHLGLTADLILVAPASANSIAKFAHGICDNLLTATILSAKCPVYIAPAMDLDMWKHPATQTNIEKLKSFGYKIIPPGNGELASGLVGEGRLAEPEELVDYLLAQPLGVAQKPFKGLKALVTAGPTYENIDPVRFIGNHSSGKMGFAIASILQQRGAEVILISGPSRQETPIGVKRIDVISARQMLEACLKYFGDCDISIMSAAVADYTPKTIAENKIKKQDKDLTIELVKTEDILARLGKERRSDQTLVGFALETDNEVENAQAKLKKKNLDFIVLNSLKDKGAGFSVDTNKVTIISKGGDKITFETKSKKQVAEDICQYIQKTRNLL